LAHDADGAFRRLVERTFASTDARVREDKPVTPAFLFAALLWGPACRRAQAAIDDGADAATAWQNAAARVLREQVQRVAVPRRFTLVIEEIWAMQPRFAQRTKKRVLRLLGHPRFRAAYDFLMLRADDSPELAELGAWWTQAQEATEVELSETLQALPPTVDAAVDGAPRKRPRRRRRGRRRGGAAATVADAAD